jgi:hypothetical protein
MVYAMSGSKWGFGSRRSSRRKGTMKPEKSRHRLAKVVSRQTKLVRMGEIKLGSSAAIHCLERCCWTWLASVEVLSMDDGRDEDNAFI